MLTLGDKGGGGDLGNLGELRSLETCFQLVSTIFNRIYQFSTIFLCVQPFCIGASTCNHKGIWCLPYAGFF